MKSQQKSILRVVALGLWILTLIGATDKLNFFKEGLVFHKAYAGEKGEVGLDITVVSVDAQTLVFNYAGKTYSTPANPKMVKNLDLKPGKTLILYIADSAVSDFLKSEKKP